MLQCWARTRIAIYQDDVNIVLIVHKRHAEVWLGSNCVIIIFSVGDEEHPDEWNRFSSFCRHVRCCWTTSNKWPFHSIEPNHFRLASDVILCCILTRWPVTFQQTFVRVVGYQCCFCTERTTCRAACGYLRHRTINVTRYSAIIDWTWTAT
jgi:hypothetical protein